ncbi:MAG: DUF6886 family protein [Roseiflexaceae bacterium]
MPDTLYHISDTPGITRFDPRPAPPTSRQVGSMVWAIDHAHLHNYLLPRDCPRVTFYALPKSTAEDIARLMAGTSARYVVAIESGWMPRVLAERLYIYDLPGDTFTLLDAGAGYYISHEPVVPRAVTTLDDLLSALLAHDVELRVMPSLWKLCDAVVTSTLQFSMIRMRNALPRDEDELL